jgi:hypothetical protein
MSQSLAAAKKRRAGIQPTDPVATSKQISQNSMQSQSTTSNMQNGLTLSQVIQVVDKRLVILETFMKENKSSLIPNLIPKQNHVSFSDENKNNTNESIENENMADFQEIVDEFNERFGMLANEISELKDIVLNLQSYTMNVNKMLLENRGVTTTDMEERVETNVNNSLNGMVLESISDTRL